MIFARKSLFAALLAACLLPLSGGPGQAQFFLFDLFRSRPAEPVPQQPARPGRAGVDPANPSQKPKPANPQAASTPAPVDAPPPPYEPQMLRLTEIMGALHYLRTLCRPQEGDVWRKAMQNLLEAEAGTEGRRETLTGSFNKGYATFEENYRACTPSATMASRLYADEGKKLMRDLTTRFVN